ncbi:hypothetical protein KDK95_13450 [Actinospica sp. MGRD01-02]|uniref:Uncharacterized protein n=1 Tax=Actinospica acidithermotolerans TaxID=2828514 RepID=A0A941EBD4_9ACTN|nr:hypothetical protein [Actinospica acidithermotolerans]MBR7827317.1 hypothetical protein [Actinospica acidithermotolerans]
MSTWVKMARYNLQRRENYLVLPWILPFCFAIAVVTVGRQPGRNGAAYLASYFIYFFTLGLQAVGRSLPFALTLGASRRSFYSGTALLGAVLAMLSGLMLAALQSTERATGGWGMSMRFFRVPYLLDGPWYDTWLTSAVVLFTLFVYGIWYGIVHSRWGLLGTLTFIAAQTLVIVAGVLLASFEHWRFWSIGSPTFAGLTTVGLTGVIAALAGLLVVGGQATIRRATV